MTLGDPQPLSRRQARELAREQGDHVGAGQDEIPALDVPALAPAALRPASFSASADAASSRRSRHHTGDESEAASEIAASDAAGTPAASDSTDPVAAPQNLSRRELRAWHARGEQALAAPRDAEPDDAEPVDAEPVDAEPVDAEPVDAEPVDAEPVGPEPTGAAPTAFDDVSTNNGWTPPIGHWSVDAGAGRAEMPAPDQSLDELINHGVGAGGIPTTTNALILPSIPHQSSSASPISNTGEIMITGSFDLPRSLGSTGAHPNLFDSSEMDHMMDQLDADQLGGDSAPVSASRAVSTHASTRGMLTPPKKQRASLHMVLVVTTAVLAVGVLGLLTGYLLGIF